MSRVNGGDGSRSGEMTALMATTGESTLIANLSSHLDQGEIVVEIGRASCRERV